MRNQPTKALLVTLAVAMGATGVTGCGPQLSKEQKQSGQYGAGMPSNQGQSADRQMSELANGKRDPAVKLDPGPGQLRAEATDPAQPLGEQAVPLQTMDGKEYFVASDFAKAAGYMYRWIRSGACFSWAITTPPTS